MNIKYSNVTGGTITHAHPSAQELRHTIEAHSLALALSQQRPIDCSLLVSVLEGQTSGRSVLLAHVTFSTAGAATIMCTMEVLFTASTTTTTACSESIAGSRTTQNE